ncbi:MAG: hypothetical protein JNL72_13190 [Flavipsychrobacter sp.]|nr:hypothetical protein [Flavipsychrobacter sp.]
MLLKKITIAAWMGFIAMPTVNAQQDTANRSRTSSQNNVPTWGASRNYQNDKYVYFPDYYTFYSPGRGYIYWNNGSWTNSPNVPSNMNSTDMNNLRIQTLDDPLNTFPERNYSDFNKRYPAQPVNGTLNPAPQVR